MLFTFKFLLILTLSNIILPSADADNFSVPICKVPALKYNSLNLSFGVPKLYELLFKGTISPDIFNTPKFKFPVIVEFPVIFKLYPS